ncbi:MAG: cytochrome c [Chromatiales bacterium]|jgi:mono/diheme cytochrome c family protein|nr:cytochrome c [Chromatiales bacterium]
MRTGEKRIYLLIAVVVLGAMLWNFLRQRESSEHDREIPFYTTASAALLHEAGEIYRQQNCKECHTLWTVRNLMQAVPAPALDGMGSIHSEEWFFEYFSAQNPQQILPSRLKEEYQMPSFAHLPESERRTLAAYMASLKVRDWDLDEVRRARCAKLTGSENDC